MLLSPPLQFVFLSSSFFLLESGKTNILALYCICAYESDIVLRSICWPIDWREGNVRLYRAFNILRYFLLQVKMHRFKGDVVLKDCFSM